ncbi:MAG TPA: alpha/beta fold hydrolase [Acidimicrobiales bacterium]|nr:alpha/beta fold hydrolase [Acidimicrobiales bacterium]
MTDPGGRQGADPASSPAAAFSSMWADLRGVPFAQRWVDAGGVRTRLIESGDPGADLVLFLHGTGGHAEAYVRNLGPHGRRFHAVAMDMVGHGFSQMATGSLEIDDYVRHVLATLDALGADRASISGESLGGWVAARLAIDHPERVNRLVLNTSGGTRADPVVMGRIRELSMRAVEEPTWDFVRQRLEWLMADPSVVTDDLIATRQAIYAQPGMVESMRATLVLQDMDIRTRNLLGDDDLKRIEAPTLVLWTSHDPTAPPEEGRRIADAIGGAELTVMDGCGHWPQYEDADTFNRIHMDFLGAA